MTKADPMSDREAEALRSKLGKQPEDTGLRLRLVRKYLHQRRPDQALELLQVVPTGEARILWSLALAGTGQHGQALRIAERAGAETDEPFLMHSLAYWLNQSGRWQVAAELLHSALKFEPGDAGMHHDLAIALQSLGRKKAALAHFQIAGRITPDNPYLAFNTALALEQFGQLEMANEKIAVVRKLMPQHLGAIYRECYLKRLLCIWDDIEGDRDRLTHAFSHHIECRGPEMISPYGLNIHGLDPKVHDAAAAYYAEQIRKQVGTDGLPRVDQAVMPRSHGKVRLGYLSADFHSHAVGGLISGLFACHDRDRFEVFAYSLAERDDEIRRQIVGGVDHYADLSRFGHDQAASRIARDQIDVLVDLGGYTLGARPQILAFRPARMQVSYLGYLNTMKAPFIDAIVADDIVVPTGETSAFSEKVLRLGRSFLPVSPCVVPEPAARPDHGIPETAFVYCCLNHSYKIDPGIFSVWCRILEQVPGSVLWLLGEREVVRKNLRSRAREENIDAQRLVFGGRIPLQEHLARMRLADLFLDTPTYNAGATAIAALQAGVPVLSLTGPRMLGKMTASLNHHLGLGELICDNEESYIDTATEIAMSPGRIEDLRMKLAATFDREHAIADYCRDLEKCLLELLGRT